MTFSIHITRLQRAGGVAAAAASLVLLAACGTSTTATTPADSATGSMSHSYSGSAAPTTSPASTGGAMPMPAGPAGPHNQADITFAQQMTAHHQGAIAMADLASDRAGTSQVKDLAAQIKAAQAPEIKQMSGWLAAWAPDTDTNGMPNKTAAPTGGMGGMSSGAAAMPGMMTDAQMGQLASASGAAFDKLFLQMMLVHHQGALTMAATETSQGKNPSALALAKSVTISQNAQLTQMKTMLQGM